MSVSHEQTEPRKVKPLPQHFGKKPQPKPLRSLFNPADTREVWLTAEPLKDFPSTHTMMSAVHDAFKAHKDLCEKHGVLHRNVAPQNIMHVVQTNFDKDSPQRGPPRVLLDLPNKSFGVLLDLDHAAIQDSSKFYFDGLELDKLNIDTEAIMETLEALKFMSSFNQSMDRARAAKQRDPTLASDSDDNDVDMELSGEAYSEV